MTTLTRRTRLAAVLLLAVSGLAAGGGATARAAAAPSNDTRARATPLTALPATVQGTTAGALPDPTDPASRCGAVAGSAWYRVSIGAAPPPRLAIQVDAHGQLDAAVSVYVKQRSQTIPVTCQRTDKRGESVFTFAPQARTTYLLRVGQLANSASGGFELSAFLPPPPASPPGAVLGPRGATGSLARVVDASAAYSANLRGGTTYAVNLVSHLDGCMGLSIYGPGTRSFAGHPVGGRGCQGYELFTPRASGRFSFLVRADGDAIGRQPFHLLLAAANASQTTPGLPLGNDTDAHGHLNGSGTGVLRLYRFDVTSRSDLELNLGTGAGRPFDLELLSGSGRVLQCACDAQGAQTLTATTGAGRYYVAVRARDFSAGSFTLRRRSREITGTSLRIDGSRYVVEPPGGSVQVSVNVSGAASGPAEVEIDRFDPVSGFQYNRTVRVEVLDGAGGFAFTPPSLGQWLMRVSFLGSEDFSPSTGRPAQVLSAGPLAEEPG